MNTEAEINIFQCLDFLRDNSEAYAKAKADRIYLEQFRKSKKAILMRIAEQNGAKVSATQEREAYAHTEYQELLLGLRDAVAEEERLRWLIVAAQAKIEVFRTLEASKRFMDSRAT